MASPLMDRVYSFAYLLVGLSVTAAPPVYAEECERELIAYSEERVLSEAGELLLEAEFPPILNDSEVPAMGILEPIQLREPIEGHALELRTARDFARYVAKTRKERFVFINSFAGAAVPVFDGVVRDGDHVSYNVSLKYLSPREKRDEKDLLLTLKTRLKLKDQKQRTQNLWKWLKVVGRWSMEMSPEAFRNEVQRGVTLAYIFGLTNPCQFHCGRELRTVIDMRDSGYLFDELNQPEMKEKIQSLVRRQGYGAFTLTLLWDSARVLEFN